MPLKNEVSLVLGGRFASEGYSWPSIPSSDSSLSMEAAMSTRPFVHCSTIALNSFWVTAALSNSASLSATSFRKATSCSLAMSSALDRSEEHTSELQSHDNLV